MSNYGPPPWRPAGPPPPLPPRPWRPSPSGTATAALVIALASIPLYFFGLVWIPALFVIGTGLGGTAYGVTLAGGAVLGLNTLPLILGWRAVRDVQQRRAHPVSRQRAILAMGISGLELLIGCLMLLALIADPST